MYKRQTLDRGPSAAERGPEDSEGGTGQARPRAGKSDGPVPSPLDRLYGAPVRGRDEEGVPDGDGGPRERLGAGMGGGLECGLGTRPAMLGAAEGGVGARRPRDRGAGRASRRGRSVHKLRLTFGAPHPGLGAGVLRRTGCQGQPMDRGARGPLQGGERVPPLRGGDAGGTGVGDRAADEVLQHEAEALRGGVRAACGVPSSAGNPLAGLSRNRPSKWFRFRDTGPHVMPSLVQLEHISKHFGGVVALDDVSLAIDEGQIVGLVGENGSGKSTLIKILSGIYTPDQGEIYIKGHRYKRLTPIQAIKEGISVIYQDFALCPNLSVAENIAIARWVFSGRRSIRWRQIYREAEGVLRQISDQIPLDVEVGQLSTADRQIVAIARALLEEAHLVIMDEPTTALTEKEVASLFQILRRLRDKGIAVLFVSHKLHEVKEICDRIVVLRDGHKVYDNIASEADIATLQIHMTGHIVEQAKLVTQARETERPLLQVKNLSLEPYFSDISFELRPYEVLGITGLLGSGRRELALALIGVLRPTSGEIKIEGRPVKIKNIWDAWNLGIGYVPEDRIIEGLHLPCSITANVILPSLPKLSGPMGFFLYRRYRGLGEHWCQELNIRAPSAETPVRNLSGGNQQRVVLAKCLATQPRILVLNSPTMGVDVASKAAIHRLMRELCEKGMGVILVSDDIPELLQSCDRILILKRGRISHVVASSSITEAELHRMLLAE